MRAIIPKTNINHKIALLPKPANKAVNLTITDRKIEILISQAPLINNLIVVKKVLHGLRNFIKSWGKKLIQRISTIQMKNLIMKGDEIIEVTLDILCLVILVGALSNLCAL